METRPPLIHRTILLPLCALQHFYDHLHAWAIRGPAVRTRRLRWDILPVQADSLSVSLTVHYHPLHLQYTTISLNIDIWGVLRSNLLSFCGTGWGIPAKHPLLI